MSILTPRPGSGPAIRPSGPSGDDAALPGVPPVPPPAGTPDSELVQALAHAFFEVVPKRYRTFCALNARIAQRALGLLGIESSLQPCQVWMATPTDNFVLGFTGKDVKPPKWDGHVICRVGPWFIDAATHHFQVEFKKPVPDVVMAAVFPGQLAAIARLDLAAGDRLWWLYPPAGADVQLPNEPEGVVDPLAQALARKVGEAVQAPSARSHA